MNIKEKGVPRRDLEITDNPRALSSVVKIMKMIVRYGGSVMCITLEAVNKIPNRR